LRLLGRFVSTSCAGFLGFLRGVFFGGRRKEASKQGGNEEEEEEF
jgi:hypothetical protein